MDFRFRLTPVAEEEHPVSVFIISIVCVTIGIYLSSLFFGDYASITLIFLTSMPLIILLHGVVRLEEKKDFRIDDERCLLESHERALVLFVYLFVGLVVGYALWFVLLSDSTADALFKSQIDAISFVKTSVGGNFVMVDEKLNAIWLNNLRVLGICFLFSLIYCSGFIFILTWNASIMGAAVGSLVRDFLALSPTGSGMYFGYKYIGIASIGLSFAVHGIPEVSAYFLASLSGGILSVMVYKQHYKTKARNHIVLDSINLLLIAVALLLLSGVIEVYITPLLF